MNKAIPLSLAIVILVLAVFNVSQWRTTRDLQVQLSTRMEREVEQARAKVEAEAEIVKLRGYNEIFQNESATLREKLQRVDPAVRMAAAAAGNSASDSNAASSKRPEEAKTEARPPTVDNPTMQQIRAQRKAEAVRRMYGDLGRELNLPPEKLDEVYGLLTVRDKTRITILLDGEKPGPPKSYVPLSPAELAARDQPLRDALGAQKFQELEVYEKTVTERQQVNQLEQQFTVSGQPLQPEQRQQLIQAMSEERMLQAKNMVKNRMPTGIRSPQDPPTEQDIHNSLSLKEGGGPAIYQRARRFMTEAQLGTLKRAQQQSTETHLSMMKMRQARAQAQAQP